MPAARPTKQQIKRAVKAWIACGLPVGGIETRPDGTVRVLAPGDATALPSSTAEADEDQAACDKIFGVGS